jgi:hypothetical protein
LVHVAARAKQLAELRRSRSVDQTGLEVDEHRAGHVLAARGLVVYNADAAELRVDVATILAIAADAVIV